MNLEDRLLFFWIDYSWPIIFVSAGSLVIGNLGLLAYWLWLY